MNSQTSRPPLLIAKGVSVVTVTLTSAAAPSGGKLFVRVQAE